jgi:lipopolysaccharide/colanic/teichoic acid biosynthesis glycosyltransferase
MNGQTKKRQQEPQRAFKPPTIFVRFLRPGFRPRTRRLGDFVAACALIAFTLPLMVFVAIVIRCDSPGPVFQRQLRVGSGGRRFHALKFRATLRAVEDPGLTWRRAPQMTRIGLCLWYTGIDDLTQFVDVLRGEMIIIDSAAYSPSYLD